MNITDSILSNCRSQPEAPALSVPGMPFVAYGRLGAMINNAMRAAHSRGLSRGNTVGIWVGDLRLHVVLILAMARLGIATVSLREARVPSGLRVDAVLSEATEPPRGAGRVFLSDFTWCMGDGKAPREVELASSDADEICRIILTSGTTGEAKGVAFTHRMVAERVQRHLSVFGSEFPNYSRIFCAMGLSTSLGYMFLIDTLSRGGTLFLGSRPEEVADALEILDVQAWIGSPAGMQSLLPVYESGSRHGRLKMILSAGSPLSGPLADRVRARLCAHVVSIYGATETSMVAIAVVDRIAEVPGAVGYLTPEVTVEAVDESDRPVASGEEGLIRIRSPYNASGYLGDPVESAKAFRNGWFYPGDFGRVTTDKMLIISGRHKNVINVGGDKTKPELVEDVLSSFAGIDEAAVLAVPNALGIEEVWAVIVSRSEINEAQLRAHCERHLQRPFVPTRFIRTRELPRNEMGKIDRRRLAESVDMLSTEIPRAAVA